MLSLDEGLPESRRKDVEMLLSRGRDLLGLVNNMLELHRIESGDVKPSIEVTELIPLLSDCVDAARYLVSGRDVTIESRFISLPERASTDPVLLRRIVTNLLSNAAKFTEHGNVTLSAEARGAVLVIEVSDTGPGIAEQDLPRLFRKFVQLEATKTKRHAGTGLGLALVRDLVTMLQGTVTVRSRLGVGTTFTITLPAELARLAG